MSFCGKDIQRLITESRGFIGGFRRRKHYYARLHDRAFLDHNVSFLYVWLVLGHLVLFRIFTETIMITNALMAIYNHFCSTLTPGIWEVSEDLKRKTSDIVYKGIIMKEFAWAVLFAVNKIFALENNGGIAFCYLGMHLCVHLFNIVAARTISAGPHSDILHPQKRHILRPTRVLVVFKTLLIPIFVALAAHGSDYQSIFAAFMIADVFLYPIVAKNNKMWLIMETDEPSPTSKVFPIHLSKEENII